MIEGILWRLAILLIASMNDSVVLSIINYRCTALILWHAKTQTYAFCLLHFFSVFVFFLILSEHSWQSCWFLHIPHFLTLKGPAKSTDIALKLPGVILGIGRLAICCVWPCGFGCLHKLCPHSLIALRICIFPPTIQYCNLTFLNPI